MEFAEAATLLAQVLTELWQTRRRPIPGSNLKTALLKKQADFDENSLGFDSFAAFVAANSESAVIRYRPGTDFLVAPKERASELGGPDKVRIAPDIWQAFVRFPKPGETRAYLKTTGTVLTATATTILPEGSIPIQPIPKELQVKWRRDFLLNQDNDRLKALASRLDSTDGLREFSAEIRANEALGRDWNTVLADEVRAIVENWANANGVRNQAWLIGAAPDEDRRAQLYAVLDDIPLAELLTLQVPLEWLIKAKPRRAE